MLPHEVRRSAMLPQTATVSCGSREAELPTVVSAAPIPHEGARGFSHQYPMPFSSATMAA